MESYKNLGYLGWYNDGSTLLTFQMGENIPQSSTPGVIDMDNFTNLPTPVVLNVGNNNVLVKGSNNQLPQEIETIVGANRLLPELIEKQIRMLYGKGPRVYREEKEGKKLVRLFDKHAQIEDWLDSWQAAGLQDNIESYCEKVIRDYYYFEDYWIKWRYYKGRRINTDKPVAGLEHIENKRCRLATKKTFDRIGYDFEDKDFNTVIVGNWNQAIERTYKVYKRFRPAVPNQFSVAISYHKNSAPGKIYAINKFYAGIKDWLVGTNRNPQYINSYLENSLNAKVHVIIPQEWLNSIETKLEQYCDENKKREDEGKELLKIGDLEIGTEYNIALRDAYVKTELRNLSNFLSGVKNQGKLFSSYSYRTSDGEASWQIKPIDLKYKEFIGSLIDYDKRADDVITTSKGIDASISNISKEDVISKSGADLYYNYLIYLHNLTIPEMKCTEAINQAIRINFPGEYKKGYRVGFYNDAPQRQEEIAPSDRLQNTVNQTAQSTAQKIEQLHGAIVELKNSMNHGN